MLYFIDKHLWSEGTEAVITTEIGEKVLRLEKKKVMFSTKILVYDYFHVPLGAIVKKRFKSGSQYDIYYDETVVAQVVLSKFLFFKKYAIKFTEGDIISVRGDIKNHNYEFRHGRKVVARISDKSAFRTEQYGLETNDVEHRFVFLCAAVALGEM